MTENYKSAGGGGISWDSSAEDFGQKVDLTVRIREILRNYPEGLSILKELIQNADDAGARTVRFCVAESRPPCCAKEGDVDESNKLYQLMKGPSLLAYNSAKFTETDFRSIQRIGDSLKKDKTGSKTGRFGVGVNSTYHLTDVPMFVSGTKCVLFDPQAEFVPGINPANPGKLIDCSKKSGCQLVSSLPHVFDPLKVFGCKLNGEDFHGTLFRFAIRTPEFAASSRLSKQSHTLESMKNLLQQMASQASQMLIFLKHVECIEIYEWNANDETPALSHRTNVINPSDTLRTKRSYMLKTSSIQEKATKVIDYSIDIMSEGIGNIGEGGATQNNEKWFVCNQLGGGTASQMANDTNLSHMKLIPWAGVAARISPSAHATSGTAYCFLPLPVQTQLPVHVNGYFELSSNRRDIWWGTDMAGDGKSRAMWNHSLLSDIVVPCYSRLVLKAIQAILVKPDTYEFLFPQKSLTGPWKVIGDQFFDAIKDLPVLYSKCAESCDWVSPADSLLLHDENDETLAEILSHDKLPLVLFQNQEVKHMLLTHKTCTRTTTPETLRQYFSKRLQIENGSLENQENKIKYAEYLLARCILGLDPASGYESLIGCQFIPLANGSLGKFHSLSKVNLSDLSMLQTMGFSKLSCMHSLRMFEGDINSAMEWLLLHRYDDSESYTQDILDPYILCDGEGASLLSVRAAETYIDADQIEDSLVRHFFKKLASTQMLNLVALESDMLADIIMRAIPREWCGCDSAKWTNHITKESDPAFPTINWFTALWRYICNCNDVGQSISCIAEQYCIVPTEQSLVCNLSPGASVMDCSTLHQSLKKVITTLGVRSLFPNVLPKDIVLPNELRSHIYEPNRNGVIMAIAAAKRRQQIKPQESSHTGASKPFELISEDDKDCIRNFLTSPRDNLSISSKNAIKSFPIFLSYIDGHSSDTAYVSLDTKENWLLLEDPVVSDYPFLTSDFLVCGNKDEMDLLISLGAKVMKRSEFVQSFIIPKISFMEVDVVLQSFQHILLNLSVISSSDPEFGTVLSKTRFVSCENPEGSLKAPCELYDPEIPQLRSLMGSDFFPSDKFTKSNSLMLALRCLGLQSSLTWDVVLECAKSIEKASSSASNRERDIAKARGKELFKFLDMNLATFFPKLVKKEISTASRFFRSVNKVLFEDVEATKRKEEQLKKQVNTLLTTKWVPVYTEPPHPYLPWKSGNLPVASPLETAAKENMWLLSYNKRLVDCAVHSEELKKLFGWLKPVSIKDVAFQLKMFNFTFERLKLQTDETKQKIQIISNGEGKDKDTEKDEDRENIITFDSLCQVFSAEVPRLYQILNGVTSKFDIDHINRILHDASWLWMGNGFVPSDHVAYTSQINTAPYLYTVPPDLACFRNLLSMFGVRNTFGSSDYCQVLQRMADECAKSEIKRLPTEKIELAVSLVQRLSDDVMKLKSLEIFAPSADRTINLASEMVYDDAPWMSRDTAVKKQFIYCHKKISAAVAEKIGVRSIRSILLQNNTNFIQFGDGILQESFGQSEALTRRLKNIIEMYPEGPQQLSEMVQNADDAKASIVRFVLSEKNHGRASLLGQKLGDWQGPAFLVYNDAVFSSRDFQNLSKIGQASKLENLTTTGRFGLGFNSVFHWTDVPSVVSGDHLVMFDPHAKYVPGATDNSRGIKIKFSDTSIATQFPDQMIPYCHFGNDMKHRFEGTLFRFPFRNEITSKESEISKNRCLEDGMINQLVDSFKKSVPKFLLFLRHVNRIEFYKEQPMDKDPQLLYYAEVTDRRAISSSKSIYSYTNKLFGTPAPFFSSDWNAIPKFLSGIPSQPLAKEAVYSKLLKTPENQLPKTKHIVSITFFNKEALITENKELKVDVEAKVNEENSTEKQEDVDVKENMMNDEYIICTALGGGKCREMACDPRFSDMKFLPWAGVAAHLSRNGSDAPNKEGNAFCFLPLPVETGLPVHINGYFELSANRRDIWHGEDMTGAGQVRSLWNRLLLNDIIAPLYCELLMSVRDLVGQRDKYFQLWPMNSRSDVWDIIKHGVYRTGQNMPMLYTLLDGGKWVSPNLSFLIDEQKGENRKLMGILLREKLNVVSIPSPLIKTLEEENCHCKLITPSLVRSILKNDCDHPSLQCKADALFLLKYCIEDIIEHKNYDELIGLPLLPLCSGNLATIVESCEDEKGRFFVATNLEKNILSNASDFIVNVWTDEEQINSLFTNSTFHGVTNLKPLMISNFVSLLGHSYPSEWQGLPEVPWNPCDKHSSFSLESKDWVSILWDYIALISEEDLKFFFGTWQILSVFAGEDVRFLLQLSDKLSVINPIDPRTCVEYLNEEVTGVIHCIGIKTLDLSVFKEKYRNSILRKLSNCLQPPTVHGMTTALTHSLPSNIDNDAINRHLSLRFRQLSNSGKDCLRNFFTDPQNMDKGKSLDPAQIQVLRAMPIFKLYNEGSTTYGNLMGDKYLPPSCADPAILDCKFVMAANQRDVNLLEKIGIETMNPSMYYESHVCPKLVFDGLLTDCHSTALEQLLIDIPRLHKETTESGLISRLSEQMIIPNRCGTLMKAKDLYDPNEAGMEDMLDDSMLPAREICGGLFLNSLRLLGLKLNMNSASVIECADSIQCALNDLLTKESVEECELNVIRKRAVALLHFLDHDDRIQRILEDAKTLNYDSIQIDDANSHSLSNLEPKYDNNFLFRLNTICWMPVETDISHEIPIDQRPPKKKAQSTRYGFSSPEASRPKCDEWLCSSSMDILPFTLRSKKLNECFRWHLPPNLFSIFHQVLALAKSTQIRVNTLAKIMPMCYEAINSLLPTSSNDDKANALTLIGQKSCIWVGDCFVPSNRVAFDAPEHASPYLFQVPKDMIELKELLQFLGVQTSFAPHDFVNILHCLATDTDGRQCSEKQLDLAVFVARYLARLSAGELEDLNDDTIYLPSRDGHMFLAKNMTYDDAPWLSAIIGNKGRTRHIFVNENISNETAAKLGTRSLREVLSAHKNGMVKIPCPKRESLEQLFTETKFDELHHSQVILDILEIAELNMTKQVSIMIDSRFHQSISVLHPCLASMQGPSIVICFHDTALEIDQIIKLTSPSKYYMAAISGESGCGGQGYPRLGKGLCGAFSFTDCLQVLTGSSLLLFDPTGECFVDGSKHNVSSTDFMEDSKIFLEKGRSEKADEEIQDDSSCESKLRYLKPSARNYCLSQSFCAQFPDQFKPFFSLPFGVEETIINSSHNDSNPHFRGTIIRLPLRTRNDNISSLCQVTFNEDAIQKLTQDLEIRLPSSFLFTYHLQSLSIDEWHESSISFSPRLRSRVSSSPLSRRNHFESNHQNDKWKKEGEGRLKNMFKSNWVPVKSTQTLEISHRHQDDCDDIIDTFIIYSILAPFRLRELANTPALRKLKLTPFVSVAAHVHSRSAGVTIESPAYSIPTGTVFVGLDTGIKTGFPFLINAPFFLNEWTRDILFEPDDDSGLKEACRDLRNLTIKGKNGQLEKRSIALCVWNRQALTSTLKELIPVTLKGIRNSVQYNYNRDSRQLYRFWPYFSRIKNPFKKYMTDDIYQSLTTGEIALFLTENDGFKMVDGGFFVSPEFPLNGTIASFFIKQTSVFTVPKLVIEDLVRCGVAIRQITPSVARHMLKKDKIKQYMSLRPSMALEMLEYCLSDLIDKSSLNIDQKIAVCRNEIRGLCLVPLSDGTVGTFGRQMIMATTEQQSLLPTLKSKFICQHTFKKLMPFFENSEILDACGITKFDAATLAHNIPSVLPSSWEGKDFVSWSCSNTFQVENKFFSDGIPSRIWIHRFWKEVSIFDLDTIQLFRLWPLIPVATGELGSCANARNILCFCLHPSNLMLREDIVREDSTIQTSLDSRLKRDLVLKAAEDRVSSTNLKRTYSLDESFWKMGVEKMAVKDDIFDNQIPNQMNRTLSENNQTNNTENDCTMSESSDSVSGVLPSNTHQVVRHSPGYDPKGETLLTLQNILVKLRCPLLDTAFFEEEDIQKIITPDRLDVSRRIVNTLNQCKNYWSVFGSSGESRLRWYLLDEDEYDILIRTICEHDGVRISLMPSDLDALKQLPVFETFAGNRVALFGGGNYYTIDESVDLSRLDDYLPMSMKEKFLIEKTNFSSLYKDLRVECLNDGSILTKFVLPAFSHMPSLQKIAVTRLILENWDTLKVSDEFLNLLKKTPFVKKTNFLGGEVSFVQANEVYDPRNDFLNRMFESNCGYFPAEEFRGDRWLDILAVIGLKNSVDKETFLECAKQVEAANDSTKAMVLFEYYYEHFADFYNSDDFIRSLKEIRCVPASFNDGNIAMYKFEEIAVHKDRNLVFRVLPVVPDAYSPPQVMFSSLGIESPPSIGNVLKQVRELTDNKNELDHWSYKYDSIEVVFGNIFSFLQDNFEKLSPLVQLGLQDKAIVPVGTTLVKANRLFFRLPKDLSPFFFEVPRAFGAYDDLLRSLGVRETPKPADYAHSLFELYQEINGGRLNANELKSVIDVINLIALEESHVEDSASFLNIFAPSSSGRLLRADTMFLNDCEWLVQSGKVDKNCLPLAHPKLTSVICLKLGIENLSQNVEEILETNFRPRKITYAGKDLSSIESNLRSDNFSDFVRNLNPNVSSSRLLFIKKMKIVQVEEIKTRYMLKLKNEQSLVDITNYTLRKETHSFLKNDTFFLTELPSSITPQLEIACSLCDYLCLDRKFVAGLSAILTSDPSVIPAMKHAMGLFDKDSCGELWRGEPGRPLLETDLQLVEIKPLKIYNRGEIVAVKNSSGELIYGTITGCTDYNRGSSVSRLRVFIGNGTEVDVLSSEVRSFKSGSKDTKSNNPEIQQFDSNRRIVDKGVLLKKDNIISTTEDFESCLYSDHNATNDSNSEIIAPVKSNEILHAVEDLLLLANLSLADDTKSVLTSNLTLKDEVEKKNVYIESLLRSGRQTSERLSKGIDSFLCPITRETMVDPVICCDGHTYERKAIEQWLRSSSRSPKTNQPLPSRVLIPNHAMRNSIDAMRENIESVQTFIESYR